MDIKKELQLSNDYVNLELNGQQYVMRKPTAMESIEIEDRNVEIEGNIDMYGYILDILKFITPKIDINDVIIRKDDIMIIGDKTLNINNITPKQGFRIILSTSKIGKNSNGEKVFKLNRSEAIKKIVDLIHKENEDITIKSFKTKDELNLILEKFQELFDVDNAMKVYNTFQNS